MERSLKRTLVEKLAKEAINRRRLTHQPESIMQKVFAHLGVILSANLGLLGDLQKINIAGDGAPFVRYS